MINKTIKILLILLVFSLAFINSHLFDLVWIKLDFLYVSWNFEFTKVIYFNILSSFIIFLFFIHSVFIDKKLKIPFFIIFVFIAILLSTIFSISPFTSLFGNNDKWHGLIMFINLIWLFIVIYNQKKKFINTLITSFLFSAFFVALIWIWQYYLPIFDYWDLSNRSVSTLWHPNYLVLILLLSIPYLLNKILYKQIYSYVILFTIISVCLFLTKSAWWILIFIFYCTYILNKKYNVIKNKSTFYITVLVFLIASSIIILVTYPEKLQSFISRFFIWSSTLDLIFSNPKQFIFWYGFETLSLTFEKSKSIYLYIFENIWFTADRQHNLILNIFYHTWLVWVSLFWYIVYRFLKFNVQDKKLINKYYTHTIIIFIIFTLLNFASIISYLILLLFIIKVLNKVQIKQIENSYIKYILILFISIISFIWLHSSYNFYKAETYAYQNNYNKAIDTFKYNPEYYYNLWQYEKWLNFWYYKWEFYFYSLISTDLLDIESNCGKLVTHFPTPENYFYCWEFLEYLAKEDLAIAYYKNWLNLLPDLWNTDSKYYNNFFIKKFIDWKRFFSEKYSNINSILDKVKNN